MASLSRLRHGVATAALAATAMVALTASQAPGGEPGRAADGGAGEDGIDSVPVLPPGTPGDGQYHTEIPPLSGMDPVTGPVTGARPTPPAVVEEQAGVPATVLAAYRNAERRLAGSDPGCGLEWELLAAIGKVESGHARGGAVDARGTTRTPILGPVLNGDGFAHISDTDGGRYDGDTGYDRAVGPMQFIPSTWAGWAADGNGDGRADPNNVYDATLAAGRYLCAGARDLRTQADLERAILSYNYSRDYLNTVLAWLGFYRSGVHAVPDGTGALPASSGAGNAGSVPPKGSRKAPGEPGGGIEVGPQPSPPGDDPGDADSGGSGDTGGSGGADGGTGDSGGTGGDSGGGDPTPGPSPSDPGDTGDPGDPGDPGDTGDPGGDAGGTGDTGGTGDPGGTGSPDPDPSDTCSADPSESPAPSPTGSGESPCPDDSTSPDPDPGTT
ncbi:lytic transglycosylase domain-containing protein [Streptomyces sp. MAR4 CNX-425]|uniref:lytic transglycosylase domain-containing protein n=1 Tax=Streptomyces sp. MAR4 CNX-425 TaxID=3406343 RepID=UPI003B51505C